MLNVEKTASCSGTRDSKTRRGKLIDLLQITNSGQDFESLRPRRLRQSTARGPARCDARRRPAAERTSLQTQFAPAAMNSFSACGNASDAYRVLCRSTPGGVELRIAHRRTANQRTIRRSASGIALTQTWVNRTKESPVFRSALQAPVIGQPQVISQNSDRPDRGEMPDYSPDHRRRRRCRQGP
jgi:hypothetical protein